MRKILFYLAFAVLFYQCKNEKPAATTTVIPKTNTIVASDAPKVNGGYCEQEVTDLGIGLVKSDSPFQIFNDSLLQDKKGDYATYDVMRSDNICPLFYKADYGILDYVCLAKAKKYYTVLINGNEVKYIPVRKGTRFISWKDYILKYPIAQKYDIEIKLLREANENSTAIDLPKEHTTRFCPLAVNGDWVQVQYDCHENDMGSCKKQSLKTCKPALTGWIRWRKDNKLLIDILTLC